MKTKYCLPVANADNIFDILRSDGIVRWNRIGDPVDIVDYLEEDLTEEEKKNLKYTPRAKVANFNGPGGKLFKGFKWAGVPDGVRIFTLIDGLVPICGEFQHGCEEIVLDLPGGNIEDGEDCAVCAKREFEEETGIELDKVISLGSRGVFMVARRTNAKNFSFIGILKKPIIRRNQLLDSNEHLGVVLVSLDDWLKLIEREFVQSYSVATTFLALMKKGWFSGR